MRFHFAITGHGKSNSVIEFVELRQDSMNECNSRHPVLDRYHVLVR
jgi:hypothetical protein